MNNKINLVCVTVFLLFLTSVSSGDLIFKMTASKNTLAVGEEATIGIWAKAEEATGVNGLNVWQLDMVVDIGDKVAVKTAGGTAITLVAPSPMNSAGSGWLSVNSPLSGNVLGIGVTTQNTPQDSTTGVGDFSLLANVTIVALEEGTVTYNLADTGTTGFYGILRDSTYYDINLSNLEFQTGNNVFTIIPEPASLLIMAAAAGMVMRSRRNVIK